MIINFSKQFQKSYKSFPLKVRDQAKLRLRLFELDPNDPQLNKHKLKGKKSGHFSINISGDIRAVYEILDKDHILFVRIGTHSELY